MGDEKVIPIKAPKGARAPGSAVDEDATHHDIATDWLARQGAPAPVGDRGSLWRYDSASGLWKAVPLETIRAQIGRLYVAKTCKRYGDYAAIANYLLDAAASPGFFEEAPVGCMTPSGFFDVSGGAIRHRPPAPDLRQRFALAVAPEDAPTDRFDQFLDQTFRHEDLDWTLAQQRLLQEVVGAALVGTLYKYEVAILLYGKTRAGKSTILRLVEALFPREFVGSVSPFDWDSEYNRASLANLRINLVGELPAEKEIPANFLKLVTGRDAVQGRYPFGRPFTFRPTCGHIFNGNDFLTTRDHHPAFWGRWLCLDFRNSVAAADRDEGLSDHIVREELPGVAHWALEGARRLVERGRFTDSPAHHALIERWRVSADAVAEFLADSAAVRIDAAASVVRGEAYDAFRTWCKDNERKPVGKRKFFERVENLGHLIGQNAAGEWTIRGVGLVKPGIGV